MTALPLVRILVLFVRAAAQEGRAWLCCRLSAVVVMKYGGAVDLSGRLRCRATVALAEGGSSGVSVK